MWWSENVDNLFVYEKSTLRIFPLCQSVFSFRDIISETKMHNCFIFLANKHSRLEPYFPERTLGHVETRDRPSGGFGVMNAKGTWFFFSDLLLASSKACWVCCLLVGRFLPMEDSRIPAINSMPQTWKELRWTTSKLKNHQWSQFYLMFKPHHLFQ